MARVTVEDCIDKVDSPYELVLVAKERATQLNSGIEPTLDRDNDKNTVIALREIASENVKVSDLKESAVYKLRKHVEQIDDLSDQDEDVGDDFENLYKGEISISGTPILPSKRARKIPEKIQVSKEDLDELKSSSEPEISTDTEESDNEDVSLENLKEEEEAKENPDIKEEEAKENPDIKEEEAKENPDIKEEEAKENPDIKEEEAKENPDIKEEEAKENPDIKEDTEATNS